MRNKLIKVTTVILICVSIIGCRNKKISGDLIIKDINIVDVKSNQVLYNQTIVIRGNKIAEIIPYAANHDYHAKNLIEGSGKYIIPGLWDMHVHSAYARTWHFPLFLAYGITGVRNMHATDDSALALVTTIKRQLANGDLLGPRFIANGPIVDGEPAVWPGTVIVRTVNEARAAVNKLADGGADFIKVYDHLTRDCYFAIMDQAKRRGIPVAGHVPYRVLPEEAAEAGQRTDEHMLGLQCGCSSRADSLRFAREKNEKHKRSFIEGLISEFKTERLLYDTRNPVLCAATLEIYHKKGMAIVPNLVIHHNNNNPEETLFDTAAMQLIPGTMRDEWKGMAGPGPGEIIRTLMRPTREGRYDNVRLMKEAGVMILAGTDVGNPMLIPGISLHQELKLLVEAGLTSAEALQTATLNPARFLGATDSLGTIEVDKLADLVVLDKNPLKDISNTRAINGVIKNGIYLDKNGLNQLLKKLKDRFKTN
jgi:imidazolonepropionase-like amidohydrolase